MPRRMQDRSEISMVNDIQCPLMVPAMEEMQRAYREKMGVSTAGQDRMSSSSEDEAPPPELEDVEEEEEQDEQASSRVIQVKAYEEGEEKDTIDQVIDQLYEDLDELD